MNENGRKSRREDDVRTASYFLAQRDRRTLAAFRVFMAVCAIGFFAFGVVNRYWVPEFYDPLWLRAVLSFLCGVLFIFSFIVPGRTAKWYVSLLYLFLTITFFWVAALAVLNRFSMLSVTQLLAAAFMLHFGFTVPRHLLLFCIYVTLLVTGAVCFGAPADFPRVNLVGLIVLGQIIAYIVVSLKQRSDLEMALAREEAERANRAKDVFLARVSHDFRAPLSAVLGFSQLLLSEEKNEEKKRMSQMVNRSAEMLLRLVDDILDFAKITQNGITIEQAPFSFHEVAETALASVRMQAVEKGLLLNSTVSERVPSLVLGDRLRVSQILANLLTNAVKYTDRGSVSLFADYRVEPGNAVPLLVMSVSDTGRGIPAADIERIFEGFLQLGDEKAQKRPGLGLGLSIVKTLVERMKGTITVESEVGKGSTFTVSLPLPPFSASV